MKTDRFLEEIKSRIDIVDLLSDYMQLRKAGQNWKGLCPFHSEKTPSFMVNPSRQMFHCFGCGKGGDIIAFLMMHENLPFQDAVGVLADKAGVVQPTSKADYKGARPDKRIGDALDDAQRFYSDRLRQSPAALEYLDRRGISEDSIGLFGIGYAPPGWQNLLRYLRNAGHTDALVRAAGLAVAGEKGLYDMFRERIIFPIRGLSGKILAFGGRALGDSLPKYINSPETAVFKKSETLFGFFTAKEAIRKKNCALIVEGYTDVIICRQYGFENVVAPLGTALTSGHIKKLRALTDRAVLVFDGDQAGRAAARRTLPIICRNNYQARVMLLPDNEDPDSYLRKEGAVSFEELLKAAKSIIDFVVTSSGGSLDGVREALGLTAEVGDVLLAEEMLIELSGRTRISEKALREEFRRIRQKNSAPPPGGMARVQKPAAVPAEECLLLSAVISFPEKTDMVLSRLKIEDIRDKTVSSLFGRLSLIEGRKDLAAMVDAVEEDERRMITRLSVDPGFDLECVDRNIEDCFRRIEERNLDERMRSEQSRDEKFGNALLNEKKKFIKGIKA